MKDVRKRRAEVEKMGRRRQRNAFSVEVNICQ